mgnify:CR=1 FL=1
MAKTLNNNEENFERYKNRLRGIGAKNLMCTTKELTISELIAEGEQLLHFGPRLRGQLTQQRGEEPTHQGAS